MSWLQAIGQALLYVCFASVFTIACTLWLGFWTSKHPPTTRNAVIAMAPIFLAAFAGLVVALKMEG